LLLEALGGPKISVGPPYFNATFVPLMTPLLIAVPIGAMLAWKRGDLWGVLSRLKAVALITFAVATLYLVLRWGAQVLAAFGVALAVWLVLGSLAELTQRIGLLRVPLARSWQRAKGMPRSTYAMIVAHAGLGVFVMGVTATAAWQSEAILTMRPGDTTELGGYQFTLDRVDRVPGPNYIADRATFTVTAGGRPVTTLTPEKRRYPVEGMPTTEAAIHTTWLRDLYIALGTAPTGPTGPDTPVTNEGYIVRIYKNPLVVWIWAGFAITGLAGLFSLTDRRHRVGAPQPARAIPAATPVAAEVGAD
jgi:cytochrome c-type biogenesis protein CcmF